MKNKIIIAGLAVAVVITTGFGFYQKERADEAVALAEQQRMIAEEQLHMADQQRAIAEANMKEARRQQELAERARQQIDMLTQKSRKK